MGLNKNKISNENDVVQFSFLDNYFNLTILTILTYYWTKSIYKMFDYILKVDSDVYPNLPLVNLYISLLDKSTKHRRIIYGYYYPLMKCRRNKNNKNYIPQSIYPLNYLPSFVAGSFYIFPKLDKWMDFINILEINSTKLIYREDIQMGIYYNKCNIEIIKINKYYERHISFKNFKDYAIHFAVHGINNDKSYYIYNKCWNFQNTINT